MKAYKLTDQYGQTKNNTQWGENVTHTISPDKTNPELCSDSWIHFYECPLIAVLLNPVHANFLSPKLWECETSGVLLQKPLKSGCKSLTTIKEIPLPKFTSVQKVTFSILCGKQVYFAPKWNTWADNWLTNVNRTSYTAAHAHAASTASAACVAAASAANYAATAAANAASANYADYVAASAANYADYADYAAASAADYAACVAAASAADKQINFSALARRALTYK